MSADPRLERAEAAAYAAYNDAAGLPVLRIAGATCYATPALPENTMLNRAVALGVDAPVTPALLDEIEEFFREARVGFAVSLSPQAPPELEAQLRERRFTNGYAWMKFARGVDAPPTVGTGLRVAQVAGGTDFARILTTSYGMPPAAGTMFAALGRTEAWHLFVAYEAAEPVGAAAMFVHDGAGWLGAAGTLPEHRGKGAQGALLAARIALARELGLELLTTETGERQAGRPDASYRNILRAGFEEEYLRPNLVSPAAPPR